MKAYILYDISRLLARRNAPTPTGIDRVDLRYALHFLNHPDYQVTFVHQEQGCFFRFNKAISVSLLNILLRRWLEPATDSATQFHSVADFSSLLKPSAKKIHQRIIKRLLGIQKIRVLYKNISSVMDDDIIRFLLDNRDRSIIYINCSHNGVGNTNAYYIFKVLGNARIIFYLHDLIPMDFPEYVREGDDDVHRRRVLAMAEYGDLILVNSKYTASRFAAFCSDKDLPSPKTSILHIGVEETFLEQAKNVGAPNNENSNSPYFISVSTIEPRKNYLLLLNVWRRLAQDLGPDCPKLIIVGKRGWKIENVIDMLDRCKLINEFVVELNDIDDQHLIKLLKQSTAILLPSFCEGWGMPVVEAITLGVPVVCSDIPAHHESAHERAIFLNTINGEAWYETIRQLCSDSEFIAAAKIMHEGYQPPLWSNHFNRSEAAIDDLLLDSQSPMPIELDDQRWAAYIKRAHDFGPTEHKSSVDAIEKRLIEQMDERKRRKYMKLKRDPRAFFIDALRNMVRAKARDQ